MLDANRLRVLVEVAHAGSIAAAAERLSFTAPALSQQLTKLERELGCTLLERGRGGVRLTAAGRVLLAHGERVLGELRAAEAAVRAEVTAHPPRLALGAFASAGKILVPTALATFGDANPHVRLALQDIEPPEGYGLVVSGDLDLLITHRYPGTALPADRGLRREKLLDDPLLVVLPDGHPAAQAPAADRAATAGEVTLAELEGEEWISGAPGVFNRVTLEEAAAEEGVSVTVAYETRDYEVTLALIRAGIGASLIPATILREAPPDGWTARELAGRPLAREIYTVHRARPGEQVARMVTTLRKAAGRALG